jgi:hypothetical protein
VRLHARPRGNFVAQRHQKRRHWWRGRAAAVVRLAEKSDSSASDDAAHLERGKFQSSDLAGQGHFIITGDEVIAIVETVWDVRVEQPARC